MRLLALVAMMSGTAWAGHSTVVVMAEPELGAALQVAMRGHGVAIASVEPPDGDVLLARAATAQHVALDYGATAALWIEGPDLYLVSADGRLYRHASLTDTSPRVFAAIARSLLDDDVRPAPPNKVAAVEPPAPRPSVTATVEPPRARPVVELGAAISPIHASAQAEVSWPIYDLLRFGVLASVGGAFDGRALADTGLELRNAGHGNNHFDLGLVGGIGSFSNNVGIMYLGVRLGYTWGHVSASIVPLIGAADDSSGDHGPGAYATLRGVLPL